MQLITVDVKKSTFDIAAVEGASNSIQMQFINTPDNWREDTVGIYALFAKGEKGEVYPVDKESMTSDVPNSMVAENSGFKVCVYAMNSDTENPHRDVITPVWVEVQDGYECIASAAPDKDNMDAISTLIQVLMGYDEAESKRKANEEKRESAIQEILDDYNSKNIPVKDLGNVTGMSVFNEIKDFGVYRFNIHSEFEISDDVICSNDDEGLLVVGAKSRYYSNEEGRNGVKLYQIQLMSDCFRTRYSVGMCADNETPSWEPWIDFNYVATRVNSVLYPMATDTRDRVVICEENIASNADRLDSHENMLSNLDSAYSEINTIVNENKGELIYDSTSEKAQSGKAVAQAIASIVDSAPDTLNTLEELATALGDDPNFATTIMTLLGGKVDKVEGKGLSQNDYTDADKAMVTNADSMVMDHDEKIRVMGDSLAQLDVDTGLLGDEIESHSADRSNPHFVTKAQVGLGNADNTSDMDKPVSIATQVALDGKVDKVEGKGLSTLDFTQEEKDTITNNKNFVQILNSTMTIQHSQFRDNLANLSEKVTEVEGRTTSAIGLAEANQADIICIKNTISDINPAPITTIPSTLEANKQYNFGEVTELSVAFPTVANDGEVIYLTFYSGATATTLSVDTTNTCDIEVVPEVNTGYEIFGKYNGSIWIVNYSEYTVSEG